MTVYLRALVASPVFLDEEKTRRAYVVNVIIWFAFFAAVTGLFFIPWLTVRRSLINMLVSVILILVVLLCTRRLLFSGRVRAAGILLSGSFWALSFGMAYMGTGLTGMPFLMLIIVTPLLTGFLINTGASTAVFVLNGLLGAWLAYQESVGSLPIGTTYAPWVRWLAYQIIFGSLLVVVYLWRRSFKESAARVQQAQQAQQVTAVFQARNGHLETAVARRTEALQASLQREHQLAVELEQALARQTELSELKSRIISRVSHEFRTPLTIINTSTDLLFQHHDKLSVEKQHRYRQRIRESIFYLTDLLNDIMMIDLAKSEGVRLNYQQMSLSELCDTLRDNDVLELAHQDRVVFQCGGCDGMPVQVDVALLKQIVSNLLTNGLKYSPSSSPVTAALWVENGRLQLQVRDQGIGIPAAEIEQIYDMFYRASNVDMRRGLGLGLFIVKTLIDELGGTLSVQSVLAQGSTFTVTLPLTVTQPDSEETVSAVN